MKTKTFFIISLIGALSVSLNNDKVQNRIETFTFLNNGTETRGKIYLPEAYNNNKNLPVIFLIDFTEQHFKLVTDEFERVIDGVEQIEDVNALVVSLEQIADINAEPDTFNAHYNLYKDMVHYVSANYSNNRNRTFIGKGSESGVVLMTLLQEPKESALFNNFIATDPSGLYSSAIIELLENNDFYKEISNKKLHFSFSTSNDRVKCNKIINLFNEANYPWLEFKAKEYTTSNYENTYPISFAEGLQFIFKN